MSGHENRRRGGDGADARDVRLKAALKANMGRRKAQARARAQAEDNADEEPPEQRG